MIFGKIHLENWINDKIFSPQKVLFQEKEFDQTDISSDRDFLITITKSSLIKSKESVFFLDKSLTVGVLFEGVIYNEKELLYRLNIPENKFPIPAIILKAFNSWGEDFANQINGDFFICIFLKSENTVLFYRDHLGIIPLAYSITGTKIFFSTDPNWLCKALFQKEKIDIKFLVNSFFSQGHNYQLLPNKKTKIVKPGHYLKITSQACVERKYWFPENIPIDYSLNFKKIIADLKVLLSDSVKIRSDHRFLASAHVSGGLDSGIVAALTRKEFQSQEEFYGFSWTPEQFPENVKLAYDERDLVKKFCIKNKIIPVFTDYTLNDYLSFVSDWRHPSEQLYEKQVVEFAKSKGVRLIFSGWGGDEFISTGNRGIDADLIREGKWVHFLKKHSLWHPKRFLSALFMAFFPESRRNYTKIKAEPSVYPYIKKALGSNRIPSKERFKHHSRRFVHLQLLELGHLAKRASDWYVKGQLNGIEYRYPLLDKRIVEYMMRVPSHALVGKFQHRILLREIGKVFFPKDIIENKSKDDPLGSHFFKKIIEEAKPLLINEFESFRNNPDLRFVDFDLLQKNLPKIRAGKMDSSIFYYLKAAHEFTKGYYGKD